LDKPLRGGLTLRSIELMYFQASNAYSASIAAGTILAVLFWNQAPRVGIGAWAVAYGVIIAIRHRLGVHFRAASRTEADAQRWLYYFATVVGISGVIWGMYGAFLAQYADTYQLAVVLLALGALLSGAVISYSVSMPVYLAFTVPTMMPIALWLILSPIDGKRFLGLMVLTWVIFMLFAAQRFRRFALESLGHQCNLEELASQLEKLSSTDSLTSLANRRTFNEELDAAVADARQAKVPLSLVLCDLDFFKDYNKAQGQVQGDVCLRSIAGLLDTLVRQHDTRVARIGGTEFAVILRQADLDTALQLGEELRLAVEQLCIVHPDSQISSYVTCSVGVDSMVPTEGNTGSDLFQHARDALKEAKRSGRNRVHAKQLAFGRSDAKGRQSALVSRMS
jgi:diguanylate cyclase (GGDEF)-like protein